MTRPLRIQFENACYHVISRGDLKRYIFKKTSFKLKFIEKLNESLIKYNIICFAYCIMDNHYHLYIQTPEGNLSEAMKHLNESYANWYRVLSQKPGHVFQGRFKSILIDHDNYSLKLVNYIHLNPCRAKIVDNPTVYKFSSLNYYLGKKGSVIENLNKNHILSQFDNNLKNAAEKYYKFLINDIKSSDLPKLIYNSLAIGDEIFINKVEKRLKEIPENSELISTKMNKTRFHDNIIKIVIAEFNITEEEIFAKKRNNFYKKFTIYLLRKQTRMKRKDIACLFGIKENSVSSIVKRMEEEINKNLSLRDTLKKLMRYAQV
ncbi:MAG: transposase [Candidatus Muirbacterium halophilum]|nr:transposase [Candidatus Muirbacterium halophilum]MCK9477077.1 transposase [Candidatus Muirbacterium halophilum]